MSKIAAWSQFTSFKTLTQFNNYLLLVVIDTITYNRQQRANDQSIDNEIYIS